MQGKMSKGCKGIGAIIGLKILMFFSCRYDHAALDCAVRFASIVAMHRVAIKRLLEKTVTC
jgi:hypothetical protein